MLKSWLYRIHTLQLKEHPDLSLWTGNLPTSSLCLYSTPFPPPPPLTQPPPPSPSRASGLGAAQ